MHDSEAEFACLLVPLPPYSFELNPAEQIGHHLKESFAFHRLPADAEPGTASRQKQGGSTR